MGIKSFLKLVEINTKVASVIPFFLGVAYTLYNYGRLNAINLIVMFFSMILFDMTVTTLNNYFDYKKAIKKEGYGFEVHNSIVKYGLKERSVLTIIILLLAISTALGLYLVYLTNYIVLIMGMACFAVGIGYSYGPIPISRTPFGEIFSGFIMGFFITFLTIYINIIDQNIVNLYLKNFTLYGELNLSAITGILIVTAPAIFCIANIMLANNICDIEEDIENNRYTLPVFIGMKKAMIVLKALFYFSYAAITFGVIMRVLPIYSLLVIFTLIPVVKKIELFAQNPTKKDTFGLVVSNFLIINVPLIITVFIGAAVKILF